MSKLPRALAALLSAVLPGVHAANCPNQFQTALVGCDSAVVASQLKSTPSLANCDLGDSYGYPLHMIAEFYCSFNADNDRCYKSMKTLIDNGADPSLSRKNN